MIVKTDKELRQIAEPFDFKNPVIDPFKLREELIEDMWNNNGLGISASQIGYNVRVFAMRGETKKDTLMCFNPEISKFSDNMNTMEEGCLSIPDVFARVVRPAEITITFLTELQEQMTEEANELTARVFQHEYDHLNGILFIDRIGPFTKRRAFEKAKKIQKQRGRGKEKYKFRYAL